MEKKSKTKAEAEHMNAVAEIGCIVCLNQGKGHSPSELHHINAHGMGLRSDNYSVIPLCHWHHRTGGYEHAIHSGKRTWECRFGTEIELLKQVKEILNA